MVSNGLIPISIQNGTGGGGSGGCGNKEMDRCSCCPYGYHIDRDFVPFTKKMLSREANVDRLRELRSKLRSQRKSMDKLLGVPQHHRSHVNSWEVETLSRASVDVWKSEWRRIEQFEKNYEGGDEPTSEAEFNNNNSSATEDVLGLENGLQAAVKDFEDALSRTRPVHRYLNYEIPDSQKFHTFPRIKAPVIAKDIHLDGDVLIMREKDSRPSIRDLTNKMEGSLISDYVPSNRHRPSATAVRKSSGNEDVDENEKREEILPRNEQVITRIRELEEQIKLIPELQVKVTLLTEEKRQVMKLLENEKIRRAKLEEVYESLKNSTSNSTSHLGDVNQNVVPAALEKRPTRDTGVGKSVLTRDVGSSPVSPTTRSIGVGESISLERLQPLARSDSSSPTGSVVGTIRRRIRTFEAGVQVTELDLGVKVAEPLLQIIEKIDRGTQSSEEGLLLSNTQKQTLEQRESEVKPTVKTKSVGTHARPRTLDVGVSIKPKVREIGVIATEPKVEKPRTKNVAISAELDKFENENRLRGVDETSQTEKEKQVSTVSVGVSTTLSIPHLESDTVLLEAFEPSDRSETAKSPSRSSGTPSLFTAAKREKSPLPAANSRESSPQPTEPKAISVSAITQQQSVPETSPIVGSPGSPTEHKPPSRIPRLTTPSTSPSGSPKPAIKSAEPLPESLSSSSRLPSKLIAPKSPVRPPPLKRQNTYTKEIHYDCKESGDKQAQGSDSSEDDDQHSTKPATAASDVSGTADEREKMSPSKEMLGALKVLNDALLRGRTTQQVTAAISIILHEWFRVAGTKSADPTSVEDYLDAFESFSPQLLRYIVNMPDGNGNTAMHYAVSHGNFDVVSILLDSKVCDPNKANKAGYTSVMLVSLAKILSDTHRQVVRRLFSMGDVNIKAAQHGQTALMLAASHGRLDTVKLLLEAGADINIQDEDGSTALMCASEHGHGEIVKYFLTQSDCDPHITDNDGSTALSIAMEAGHKDIGVMLYAHMHFVSPNPSSTSPSSMRAKKSRSETPRSSPNHSSPSFSSQTSPIVAKKQFSTH